MPQVKFGRKQLTKPTPAGFEFWVKIFVGVSGLLLAWMPTNNIVPHGVQDVITPICNLVNSVMLFLLPFFGVQIASTVVRTKDVKVMEEKPESEEIPKRD